MSVMVNFIGEAGTVPVRVYREDTPVMILETLQSALGVQEAAFSFSGAGGAFVTSAAVVRLASLNGPAEGFDVDDKGAYVVGYQTTMSTRFATPLSVSI